MNQSDYASRLNALRHRLATQNVDGFLVPMADEYQSEYVPPFAQRVDFLSGFTGSAGYIVVLKDHAGFFTDSRYTLQAAQQVPQDLFTVFDSAEKTPTAWLEENTGTGTKIGFDPWLHTVDGIERLKKSLAKTGAEAVAVTHNPVDAIWDAQPAPPCEPIHPHDIAYSGKSSEDKRRDIAAALKKKNCAVFIVADPTSVAWLLNVRGGDVANTPLPLSRAIIRDDGSVQYFIDERKITDTLPAHLGGAVSLLSPDVFADELAKINGTVWLDTAQAAEAIAVILRTANIKFESGEDPCELPRAVKNTTEIDGMRAAHRRDGAALARFFAWLDQRCETNVITERGVEQKLAGFREANNHYRGPSFDTIAGAGEHGAIVHYRAVAATDAELKQGQLFLLDSGGQYLDGTTDVTRTVAIGTPSAEMRDRFTRVLKGHIALAAIKFPVGTSGGELDVLARQYLWEVGLDYGHGTGHGVGCYLGVHEGPQGISKRSKVPLQPGMVVSNEPGFYKAGHYGIRIENLQTVVEILNPVAERKMLGFETLTLAPIDRKLIDVALMNDAEIKWLNDYHARVKQVISPMVDESTRIWLEAATLPVTK